MRKRLIGQQLSTYKQSGASSLGIMAGMLILASFITVGVKVGPLFMENMSLDSAIKSAASKNFHSLSEAEIREALQKTFRVNNISVNPKDFEIKKTSKETVLSYLHEERTNVIANIDAVVTFENYYSTAD